MVAMYTVMGRQVGSHYLAMATLGFTFGGAYLATRGPSTKPTTPPINASSKDEEKFIQEFLQQVEQEDKKSSKTSVGGDKASAGNDLKPLAGHA